MSRGKNRNKQYIPQKQKKQMVQAPKVSSSLLDVMVDGREFESLLHFQLVGVNFLNELRRSIQELESVRGNYVISYVANVIKPKKTSVSIDNGDDLPFSEMVRSVPAEVKEIDLVLVTPGGYASQVAKFVNTLRPRFERVNFIILNMAMSAGTIFSMSGDEIVMSAESYLGPIDPQTRNKDNQFVPYQSILTLLEEIKTRGEKRIADGEKPEWADLEILRNLDPKEVGNAISASQYSIKLVNEFLYKYKFKHWTVHSNDEAVTDEEKGERSKEIAELLCNHGEWKIHGHAINRDEAWDVCKLKITHTESIENLPRAIRRMWATYYWIFENSLVAKVYIS